MGFRIALYMSSLFSSDTCDFRPRIQYSFCSWRSSCFLFVVICLRQVSLRSRCMPKYFTSSGWTGYILFNWTDGHGDCLRVKVTWVDFVSLAFIHHFFEPLLNFKQSSLQCVRSDYWIGMGGEDSYVICKGSSHSW